MSMDRVSAARRDLILDYPFFGVLSLKLDLVEDLQCETFVTDGAKIVFNPEFANSLDRHELAGVIAHEVLHCSNGHPWRREHRDHERWNYACDYAINPILLEAGLTLPKDALDGSPYKGMSAEEIYAQLESQEQQSGSGSDKSQGQSNGQGQGGKQQANSCGKVADCDQSNQAEMKADWAASVLRAAKQAQAIGKLPGGLERLVEEIKNPPQDWRSILRRFVQENATSDYSWKMPNPRYLHSGLYLPALRSENMPSMVVAIDTSGSINDVVVGQFAKELDSIVEEMQPERVHVVYCDAKVRKVDVFERGELVTIAPQGGGGTDFRPVFDWVEEEGIEPSCLVYLTDMAGRFPDGNPAYPVLWGDTSNRRSAPWGDVVQIRCD